MIIKIKSRRTKSFAQLAQYIMQGNQSLQDKYFVAYNFHSSYSAGEIAQHFEDNVKFKSSQARNTLYHIVLSFSPKDTPNITNDILHDLTHEFINRSGLDKHLVFGLFHTDKKNCHVHLMASSNQYRSSEIFRLSKSELKTLCLEMETYQQQQYPELQNSIVHLPSAKRTIDFGFDFKEVTLKKSDSEIQLAKRNQKPQKRIIQERLFELAKTSNNTTTFLDKIKADKEFSTYSYRNNQFQGIQFENKKYRFTNLFGLKDIDDIFQILRRSDKSQLFDKDISPSRDQSIDFER